ncbi:MAG: DinB family protein [Candidatus Hydrogenedentes bacterium]|nr:DinB family protein [Candidatus Hydrogenedentota bacterium]
MGRTKIEVFEKLYESTFSATTKAAANVPVEKRLTQTKDGKAHPLWLMGHLAFATDTILNGVLLGGDLTLPEQYRKVFAPGMIGGAPVTPDASAYPAWDDVVAQYERVAATTMEKLKSIKDEDLAGGMKGQTPPGFEEFFKSFEGVLSTMVTHDTYHRGQMNLLANA